MGLFGKNLSSREKREALTSIYSGLSESNLPKQVLWQCRYCGQRHKSSSAPKAGICNARGKVNGRPRPHEWHKVR